MFRKRQSSDIANELGSITIGARSICMQRFGKLVANKGSCQGSTGTGGINLSSSVGALAKGTPRNASPLLCLSPITLPSRVESGAVCSHDEMSVSLDMGGAKCEKR